MQENGTLIRLFPVPFRFIDGEKQFKKWQWINARIEKANNDHRPESHRLFVDTITFDATPIPTSNSWRDRRVELEKLPVFPSFDALQNARLTSGVTLGLVRPTRILGLDIQPVNQPEWSKEEMDKLLQFQLQGGLFDKRDERKSIATLRKLPFDFHYRYTCTVGTTDREARHKISDWEAGALFWTCKQRYRDAWEAPFRKKLETTLPAADLMFLMGTVHRFPDQWMIVSLIYPPKPQIGGGAQGQLFPL